MHYFKYHQHSPNTSVNLSLTGWADTTEGLRDWPIDKLNGCVNAVLPLFLIGFPSVNEGTLHECVGASHGASGHILKLNIKPQSHSKSYVILSNVIQCQEERNKIAFQLV